VKQKLNPDFIKESRNLSLASVWPGFHYWSI